jgi:hypothetical protein
MPVGSDVLLQLGPLFEEYSNWLRQGGILVIVFLGTYLLGRVLVVPPIARAVASRNPDNKTLVSAIRLYLRVVVAVLAVPIAITAAGFGGVAFGSGVILAAATLALGIAGRDVIGNLVSGVFLVADSDFNVGDYIEWDESADTPTVDQYLKYARELVEQNPLLVGFGITWPDLLREPVDLRHREVVRLSGLDVVLGGDHAERVRERPRLPVGRHLALLHRLQQGRLRLRRRPVDLVAEDDVGEHRPRLELELVRALVKHVDAGDVGGEEVRGELDPLERAVEGLCDGTGEHRLADAGDVFQEDVSLAEHRREDVFDLVVVADDHLFDVVDDTLDCLPSVLDVCGLSCGGFGVRHGSSGATHTDCRNDVRYDHTPEDASSEPSFASLTRTPSCGRPGQTYSSSYQRAAQAAPGR